MSAAFAQGRRAQWRAVRVACVWLVVSIVAFVILTLRAARLDYAHQPSDERTCGLGVGRCPNGEQCTNDDYTFIVPIGHCERPCESLRQTCSASGKQCRFKDEFADEHEHTLICVQIMSGLR